MWGIAEANIIFYNSPKSKIQERITFQLTKYPIKFCQRRIKIALWQQLQDQMGRSPNPWKLNLDNLSLCKPENLIITL